MKLFDWLTVLRVEIAVVVLVTSATACGLIRTTERKSKFDQQVLKNNSMPSTCFAWKLTKNEIF